MSATENSSHVWNPMTAQSNDAKYEKCRNITEEIYKRINITFQIKKLETETQSDVSDNSDTIDSNELSNETDLFACDKTSLSSSTDAERPRISSEKFINNNNNEETKLKKAAPVYKRPRKRFRKRIKKRTNKTNVDSDLSSDEVVPLSRVDLDASKRDNIHCSNGSLDSIMGVPKIGIINKDLKPKTPLDLSKPVKNTDFNSSATPQNKDGAKKDDSKSVNVKPGIAVIKIDMRNAENPKIVGKDNKDKKNCSLCSLSFSGERGLRRHMTMSHIVEKDHENTTKLEVRSA